MSSIKMCLDKLQISPGDLLIIKFDSPKTPPGIGDEIRKSVQGCLPDNVDVIIINVPGNIDLAIINRDE